ncbi:FAD-binding oxidoreductase [Paracoccus aerodenitrificans]|uniref:FAD-binding oxidoreductase n=1 Tax=Paracoccus aerodenitrificans TaxID=3017781 RepID=UPI0022F0E29A|nr:FAD-binding oxidoreductase [Paracoccus aerodenitrificans]WBU65733.1 FAD-binding oxidoreductase [Paracoccus aerodenitrificans]
MLNSAGSGLAGKLPQGVLRDIEPRHLEEPRGRYHGHAGLLAAPHDVEETAAVVKACSDSGVGIVPLGGGTGLVGGQVMTDGPAPLILSTERMNAVRNIWPDENVMIAGAGVTLQQAREAAADKGRMFPLSLASQGSASIGGVLATNAGGVNTLRYGTARALCLGIEAVMPDGSILRDLKRLRKDNTGYDIRDLLIGAEGTLGIITAASLQLVTPPAASGVALLVVPDPAAALSLLALARQQLGDSITAFELISGQGLRFLAETMPELRQPFDQPPAWMVLIEAGPPRGLQPDEVLETLFETGAADGLILDGLIAQSGQQAADFWRLREEIPQGNRRIGAISSHDISLPLSEVPGFIRDAGAMLERMGDMRVNCFGHLGDGNLHYNVFPAQGHDREEYDEMRPRIQRDVHELVVARGGSFSAEHGIGRLKIRDLERWGDPTRLAVMWAVKTALDPKGIMNPGAVLS